MISGPITVSYWQTQAHLVRGAPQVAHTIHCAWPFPSHSSPKSKTQFQQLGHSTIHVPFGHGINQDTHWQDEVQFNDKSHASHASSTQLPHTEGQSDGQVLLFSDPEHTPSPQISLGSIIHALLHPSLSLVFPSSHCSVHSTIPLPQLATHTHQITDSIRSQWYSFLQELLSFESQMSDQSILEQYHSYSKSHFQDIQSSFLRQSESISERLQSNEQIEYDSSKEQNQSQQILVQQTVGIWLINKDCMSRNELYLRYSCKR